MQISAFKYRTLLLNTDIFILNTDICVWNVDIFFELLQISVFKSRGSVTANNSSPTHTL